MLNIFLYVFVLANMLNFKHASIACYPLAICNLGERFAYELCCNVVVSTM